MRTAPLFNTKENSMRKSEDYYATVQKEVVELVPDGAERILEIGCGTGLTASAIKNKSKNRVEIVGIEIEPDIAEKAKKNIDKVINADAERIELPYDKGYFDCIIYAGILEHLRNPWDLLIKNLKFLKQSGYVIAIMPNIAHYRIIKMLLKKEWNYRDRGILDDTHLRFFALKNIKAMFNKANLKIIEIIRRISASKQKKIINKVLFGIIADYLTEEYIILAKKCRKI